MAALPNTSAVTVDEYFDQGLWSEYEYVEGFLMPRRSGNASHARMVVTLSAWLEEHNAVIDVYAALVVSVSRDRYRVPDVCAYGKGTPQPDLLETPSSPPLAVFEILSPTDVMDEMLDKLDEYRSIGVPHAFIIDMKRRRILRPDQYGGLQAIDVISIPVGSTTIEAQSSRLFRDLT